LNKIGILPVLILYKTFPWIKVSLGSFQKYFPNDVVLVIDNNPDTGSARGIAYLKQEGEWVRNHRNILYRKSTHHEKHHGYAMDFAASIARDAGYKYVLFFEPDCLITGRSWFNKLVEEINHNWMIGSHLKDYGPIHPTPSIWNIDKIKTSFEVQLRCQDECHPRFHELFDLDFLRERVKREGDSWEWWKKYWDTAQRAWFLAAIRDKAKLVDKADDFIHFWGGSKSGRDPYSFNDPRLIEYLN
jgi:hypothetical protein